jgi:hypothetical protein
MKLCQVKVIGPNPGRYRGLTGANDQEVIEKAKVRHAAAGFPVEGHQFSVTSALTVVGAVAESDPDTTHPVFLTDAQLAEVEAALSDRIGWLRGRVAIAEKRPSPALPTYQVQLQAAQSAFDSVVAV